MKKTEIYRNLHDILFEKYKVFQTEDMFIYYNDDIFVVDWHKWIDQYINKNYIRWIINFIRKYLNTNSIPGYFYVGPYAIKLN